MIKKIIRMFLTRTQFQTITVPKGAKCLGVGIRDSRIVIWYQINTNESETELRRINIIETETNFDSGISNYVDTVQFSNSPYCSELHVFEGQP